MFRGILALAAAAACSAAAVAQTSNTAESRFTGRTIQAIGYRVSGGGTTVDLKSTGLVKGVSGEARVDAKPAVTNVEVKIDGLAPPTRLGAEFLTYVVWAVSPQGRAINLGPVIFGDNGRGRLTATTQLQTFSLFVTAEPYSAVRQPGEMVILENAIRKGTKGKIFLVNDYMLLKRSQYEKLANPLALSPDLKKAPLEIYEARNAVTIAKSCNAAQYAPSILSKAQGALDIAEKALERKASRKEIVSSARQAAQFGEDARAFSVERQEAERVAAERAAAAARARADAEAEAKRRADAEARRQAELAAAREGRIKAEAAAREARMRAEAEIAAAKARAEADALRAREDAARAEAERAQTAAAELRARLFDQFARIMETRDTARGLVVTMADVFFDTGKYDIRMDARERLARFSGIVLAHPGLTLQVEGHTDSTGSEELNLKLSQQRADAVRSYLVRQGIVENSITAFGFGRDMPVADNDTPAGRQKNRRVEVIVSGEVIGVRIGR